MHWFFSFLIIMIVSTEIFAQKAEVSVLTFEEFEPFMQNQNDTTYVINFWATWCKPCVEELPYFEAVHDEMHTKKVKVILISLDDIEKMETKVKPFVTDMDLRSDVYLLNDINYNAWINKVDPSWSGSIPATLIYNKSYRKFYEQSFEFEELKEVINKNRIKS